MMRPKGKENANLCEPLDNAALADVPDEDALLGGGRHDTVEVSRCPADGVDDPFIAWGRLKLASDKARGEHTRMYEYSKANTGKHLTTLLKKN